MKKVLLIVDDEPAMRLILEHYFGTDYQVVTKANGPEAVQWLESGNCPAAIVADYSMPVMNGARFIQRIRADKVCHSVPLIILSGKDSSSTRIECLKMGADDYQIKPFSPEELALRLQNLLNRVRA
ncbi:response regulator transcription factor [Hymenobacter actinosclerus]|uniref:Response regulator receiver domain-containing protein n=1 Tax=Hymenobacter actinosclerus TaxID=82805 RepID=A0A1I0J5X4_9BACT|nr:response regulator transcription factor [Hymenobacter actinosclerus]SEU04410.1 Response regulator receiver domain-containing protein [Hymenobacter actinosclerus]